MGLGDLMDDLDLSDCFLMRTPMLRSCPSLSTSEVCDRVSAQLWRRDHRAKVAGDEQAESRAWEVVRPHSIDLEAQVHLAETSLQDVQSCFAEGRWVELIERARQCATPISGDQARAG